MKGMKYWLGGLLLAVSPAALEAQKAMTVQDLAAWERITGRHVSDDGAYVAAQISPWVGDASVRIYQSDGKECAAYKPASSVEFSASSGWAVVKGIPSKHTLDSLKVKKAKEEEMPMDRLYIRDLKRGAESVLDSIRSYQLSEEADWLAYQRGRKDSTLYVVSMDGKQRETYGKITDYGFAEKAAQLYFVSVETGKAGLYVLDLNVGKAVQVKAGDGDFRQMAFDEGGTRLAFLYAEKDSIEKKAALWLAEKGKARELVARGAKALPRTWVVSPHGTLSFSRNGERLFFGTAPCPVERDSTILDTDFPNVQVWSWNEPVQHTVQNFNREEDLKRSYQAVYNLQARSCFQLADTLLEQIELGDEGNAPWALLSASKPYFVSSMWEGRTRYDTYRVSLDTGEKTLLAEADYRMFRLSPEARYALAYSEMDSSWYSISLADGKEHRLSTPQTFRAWEEEMDVPDYPYPYGVAGWSKGDASVLLYDRYDIWQFDPEGKSAPRNLTQNGRAQRLSYRLQRLDEEERAVDMDTPQLLLAFDERTKGSAVYRWKAGQTPVKLMGGAYQVGNLQRAKKADVLLFSKESFAEYPDIRCTDSSFKQETRLTHLSEQQANYKWGSAELVSWVSLDGDTLEGVLYKPADFDPTKQYPMLVNFYERNAETLYEYHIPEPHRSTIDYHLYLSNGYVIFNPDIRYKAYGLPGEDCFKCLMPGVMKLIEQGFVNPRAIGAQGHSWGGYQVAYLAARTRLFAAIESGAPVVNMFSAYGGIRWGSGLNRSFQYEHGQSRVGGTPWDAQPRYYENSPLFRMDLVETPLLIMHNDADGHVPWYQGIEYFVALKRLQKPVWMLNYTGEPHWPLKLPNRIDFQTRMFQFFNHYLKGEEMPRWMEEGVPAVRQTYDLGY